MMIIVRVIILNLCLFLTLVSTYSNCSKTSNNLDDSTVITTDNRIKTYEYNENLVYLLVLHPNFQSNIEFEKGEWVKKIIKGEKYAWDITHLPNMLSITPLVRNMRTNMTIITNKRTYRFDVVSKDLDCGNEKELVYVVKFNYPKKNKKRWYPKQVI